MRDKFAQIISIVFHPLLMPTYLFLIIITFAGTLLQPLKTASQFHLLIVIFLVTFIIPAISIGTLRLSNIISDLKLENRKQRFTPFLFITCFYGVASYLFYTKVNVNSMFYELLAITTILILVLTIITFYWKISIHGAGVGGLIGFVLALSYAHYTPYFSLILSILILIAGLVVYARLRVNAHTPMQVYSGFILGLLLCFSSLKLIL